MLDIVSIGTVIGAHRQIFENGRLREYLAALGHQCDTETNALWRRQRLDLDPVQPD
jgi:hypothetical protein